MAGYSNVRKFRRRPTLNVGVCIFAVIFIYMLISVIIYAASKKTIIYEVVDGSLASEDTYQGFIVRDETVIKSDYSGSVNYFLKSGHKAGLETVICSVDETGRVYDRINEEADKTLSKEALAQIRAKLSSLTSGYNNDTFYDTYNYSDAISGSIFEFQSDNIVDSLDDFITDTKDDGFFHKITTDTSGIIVYSIDGYENFSENDLSDSIFDYTDYKSSSLQNVSITNKGDAIYKRINSDKWNIYIRLNETEANAFSDRKTINIRFVDDDISCTAGIEVISRDESYYGKLTLSRYMVNFADKRFVNVEVAKGQVHGLKIPNSAILSSNAYKIPKSCMFTNESMIKESYDEQGQVSYINVTPDIYYADEDYYYISTDNFKIGDILRIADSDEIFVVGTMAELDGVYCVNKGYAVFKAVNIIDKNKEYSIVTKGREYSLAKYDHIVLDHTTVKDDDIVN